MHAELMDLLRSRLGDRSDEAAVPPPVFAAMEGELLAFDACEGTLSARFPVRESYLNPYGTMQGGMVAAAVDNTLGPLSVLLAPPSVTRQLQLTYRRPATLDMGHIVVVARLAERRGRRLFFTAEVRSSEGLQLARAKATHWVFDQGGVGEEQFS